MSEYDKSIIKEYCYYYDIDIDYDIDPAFNINKDKSTVAMYLA